MEQGVTISDILSAIRRRLVLIVLIAATGTAMAIAVAWSLPPKYRTSAKILVESQQIPTELARSTVTTKTDERLRLIEQRLMARESLLALADRLRLFDDAEMSQSAKVGVIRKSTTIAQLEPDQLGSSDGVSGFTITYEANDADLVARVVNEFADMVIEQNLRTRSEHASETLDFFKSEVGRLQDELLSLETRITDFKNKYADALPDSLQFRRDELTSLRDRRYQLEQRQIELHEKRRELEQAMAAGGDVLLDRKLTPEEQDLQGLRRELVRNRAVYAETHPEVRTLVAQIRALERTMVSKVGPDGEVVEGDQVIDTAAAESARALRRIELIESQLALVGEQRAAIEGRQTELEATIEQTPQVEMALSALDRRYENLKSEYQLSVRKQAEAATGEKLEINHKAERFEVLERALVPEAPVSPKRKLIAAGGAAASAGLAFGLVVLLELLNTRVRTSADLLRHLELRPVATVPMIRNKSDKRWRLSFIGIKIAVLLIGVPLALYLVDQYYMPLSGFTQIALEKTGLDGVLKVIGVELE